MSDKPQNDTSSADIEKKLAEIVAKEAMVDISVVKPESRLDELGIQSADFVMILMEIEDVFGIYVSVDDEMSSLQTVGDFIQMIVRRIEENALKAAT